jgi:hypothetical protein
MEEDAGQKIGFEDPSPSLSCPLTHQLQRFHKESYQRFEYYSRMLLLRRFLVFPTTPLYTYWSNKLSTFNLSEFSSSEPI